MSNRYLAAALLLFASACEFNGGGSSSGGTSGTSGTTSAVGATTSTTGNASSSSGSTQLGNGSGSSGASGGATSSGGLPSISSLVSSLASVPADGVTTTTLTLTLLDGRGNPVAGQAVSFLVTGGGNTLTPASGTTNASGVFTSKLASTRAETKIISVAGTNLSAWVTFVPGAPSTGQSVLLANPGTVPANGTATSTLLIIAEDAAGNAISGLAVSLASTGSNNTFGSATGTTDATGSFSTTLTSTTAEPKTVTATLGSGGPTLTTTVTFVSSTVTPSSLTSSASNVVADGTTTATLTLTLYGANGSPVSGQAVTMAATGSANTFTPASGSTNASGVFSCTLSSTVAETKVVSAGGLSVGVTFVAGAPTAAQSTLLASPSSVPADGTHASTVLVIARDAHGNAAPGVTISLMASGASNTFAATSGPTDTTGSFSTTLTSTSAQSETVTATLGASGPTISTSVTFTPTSVNPSSLVTSASQVIANGTATATLTLTLLDANGNPIVGQAITPTATGTADSFAPVSGVTSATGVFTTAISSTKAETKVVTMGGLSVGVTFIAGPATSTLSTILDSPSTLPADGVTTSTILLIARDAQGNAANGITIGLVSTGLGNIFGATSGTTDATGSFSTTLASTVAEVKTVTATLGTGGPTITTTVIFTQVGCSFGGTAYDVGRDPVAIASGDLDGDGLPDTVVANSQDGTVSVALSTGGELVYQVGSNYVNGPPGPAAAPSAVAIADIENSGFPDIVVANAGDGTVDLIVNQWNTNSPWISSGSVNVGGVSKLGASSQVGTASKIFDPIFPFQLYPLEQGTVIGGTLPLQPAPSALAIADFDGDGWLDVAIADSANGVVTIIWDTAGAFPAENPCSCGGSATDSKRVKPQAETGITCNGCVYFPAASSQSIKVGTKPAALASADLNQDGWPDLAVANSGDGTVDVLLSADWALCSGASAYASSACAQITDAGPFDVSTHAVGTQPVAVAIGDYNDDGTLDIAVANRGSLTVGILTGGSTPDGGDFMPQTVLSTFPVAPVALASATYSGLGRSDLAVALPGSSSVAVFNNNGVGLPSTPTNSYAVGSQPVALATVNHGSSPPGLASANSVANTFTLLQNSCAAAACTTGFDLCSGACVDIAVDAKNCGGCGETCGATDACCSSTCSNPSSDANNCGGCGLSCGGELCCSSLCSDQTSDPNNCGGCGVVCDGGICGASSCEAATTVTPSYELNYVLVSSDGSTVFTESPDTGTVTFFTLGAPGAPPTQFPTPVAYYSIPTVLAPNGSSVIFGYPQNLVQPSDGGAFLGFSSVQYPLASSPRQLAPYAPNSQAALYVDYTDFPYTLGTMSVTSGAETTISDSAGVSPQTGTVSYTPDGTQIVYVDIDDELRVAPASGGGGTTGGSGGTTGGTGGSSGGNTVLSGFAEPGFEVTADSNQVVYLDSNCNLAITPLTSSSPTVLAAGNGFCSSDFLVTPDVTHVVQWNGSALLSILTVIPTDGGGTVQLAQGVTDFAVSADSSTVVYSVCSTQYCNGTTDGTWSIPINGGTAKLLASAIGSGNPTFFSGALQISPDGETLVIYDTEADDTISGLWTVPMTGGTPTLRLNELGSILTPTWIGLQDVIGWRQESPSGSDGIYVLTVP